MKKIDVSRAMRDPEYRATLSRSELAALPQNPVGMANVEDDVLKSVTGGCEPTTEVFSCVPPGAHCP